MSLLVLGDFVGDSFLAVGVASRLADVFPPIRVDAIVTDVTIFGAALEGVIV